MVCSVKINVFSAFFVCNDGETFNWKKKQEPFTNGKLVSFVSRAYFLERISSENCSEEIIYSLSVISTLQYGDIV